MLHVPSTFLNCQIVNWQPSASSIPLARTHCYCAERINHCVISPLRRVAYFSALGLAHFVFAACVARSAEINFVLYCN